MRPALGSIPVTGAPVQVGPLRPVLITATSVERLGLGYVVDEGGEDPGEVLREGDEARAEQRLVS